ncbi:hypothetical protein TNCV_3218121 [Trichonephila clavipes]|nr:hypothetical protein TNCV_3218121 [Trichonephila clavipes]
MPAMVGYLNHWATTAPRPLADREPPRAAISAAKRHDIESAFECLPVEENSILLVCAEKVRLLKLQDADHDRDTDKPNPTSAHISDISSE